MKTLKRFDNLVTNGYPVPTCTLEPRHYRDGSLAIEIVLAEYGEPWATATVNLDAYTGAKLQSATRAYLDVNNCGNELMTFLVDNKIARPTGLWAQSGFCQYPLFEFDLNALYVEE